MREDPFACAHRTSMMQEVQTGFSHEARRIVAASKPRSTGHSAAT